VKRNNFLFIITTLILSSMSLALKTQIEPAWKKIPSSVDESGVMSLLVFPAENSSIILAGTEQALYRSTDEGKTFRPVLQLPSSEKRINYLYINGEVIFAATNSGLFVSQDQGLHWEKIFSSADPLARHCLSVLIDRDAIYLGTENGLFYQKSGESSWQKKIDFLNADSMDKVISSLEKDKQFIYVSTSREVFRIDKDRSDIQKIFSLANREQETETEIPAEFLSGSESFTTNQIKQIKIVQDLSFPNALVGNPDRAIVRPPTETFGGDNLSSIYLATTKGIFQSLDQGKTWTNLNSAGLPVENITSLLVLPDQDIWVGTLKGVFRYHDGRWLPLYKGMETNRVNFLTLDEEARVYAATDRGIFFMDEKKAFADKSLSFPNALVGNPDDAPTGCPIKTFGHDNSGIDSKDMSSRGSIDEKKIQNYFQAQNPFKDEPSIHQVHEMAIRYAEVHPQKITRWRSAAQKRGLMPKVSAGINRSATDMFHWDTGPNPDVLAKGRDFLDWNVSLSWELGDLIWNPDQTSIDSRSKLMVELREDVLDQITRLYFERRRVQLELAELASKELSESSGQGLESEKEMRVEELTALIDALTGGEFSRRIQEDKK